MNERDICTKFITPALRNAGWDEMTQLREEVRLTKGRILVRGKVVARGKGKRADYVLYYRPNIPIAVVEAKDSRHSALDGLQQALEYASILDVPFAFSTNGDAFVFHDRTGTSSELETNLAMDQFPSPEELWAKYRAWRQLADEGEALALQDYYYDGTAKSPRYYQVAAINAATAAIAAGQSRILLVMATGTGKTYTAFQIIWRLWKSGRKKRILFLADRNILIDQTMVNDFRPFGPAMAKLSTDTKTIGRREPSQNPAETTRSGRRIDTAFEIYLSLYQAITGPGEEQKLYREFSPNFFDLIVVDECHRGSAAEDSAWREILEYFSSATQIGLTATPKETTYVSNIEYFGKPVYSYSLKQGISDGFLAPYKVVKVDIDVDVEGYEPGGGRLDRHLRPIENRTYGRDDFDRSLVIDERTKLVTKRISEYLRETGDRFQKTIVFCVDEEHAARMRQALINENRDLCSVNHRYVMRITGGDVEGNAELGNFIDPEASYPVIVTTSRLLSTGVDVQTCRVIALDRPVGSITEFKQILGRGTRIHEDSEKYYFTILDFRGATSHFADPSFDGDPVQVYTAGPQDPVAPPDDVECDPGTSSGAPNDDEEEVLVDPANKLAASAPGRAEPRKLYVEGVAVEIHAERVEYLDARGALVTESLRDFARKALLRHFGNLDDFLQRWHAADRKQALIDQLADEGVPVMQVGRELGKDLDPFDLICELAFGCPPITRRDRAAIARQTDTFAKHGDACRSVLEKLLEKYEDEGILDLDDPRILQIAPFSALGTPMQLIREFGTRKDFEQAVRGVQSELYPEVA
ncbi:EcoAI/FtnUII family type I restriction enzme subunit R [Micromonospora sp. NPDC094482]|uniref:EcoAI/FtnUII family type I restriction enzme subunit R n=1 Tax=unclassified Micromonospora TaxID=2617518 RepID=UPI003332CC1B